MSWNTKSKGRLKEGEIAEVTALRPKVLLQKWHYTEDLVMYHVIRRVRFANFPCKEKHISPEFHRSLPQTSQGMRLSLWSLRQVGVRVSVGYPMQLCEKKCLCIKKTVKLYHIVFTTAIDDFNTLKASIKTVGYWVRPSVRKVPSSKPQVWPQILLGPYLFPYRGFSHGVTAAMLVFQTSPVGVELFSFGYQFLYG